MSREMRRRQPQGELWQPPYPPQYYTPPMPQYLPPAYPQYPPEYMQYPQPLPYERPRRRRRRRRLLNLPGPAQLALYFVLSWVPAGFGMGGGTVLCWGFIVVWLCARAWRNVE